MLNIVIPMAGHGSRFFNAGFKTPKPLIQIHGIPMVNLVIQNIRPSQEHRFIFICQKEHDKKYSLNAKLKEWSPNSIFIGIDHVTDGAACTVLLAENYIDNDSGLMIANSDQWIDFNINKYLSIQESERLDGQIMTMEASDPKWSYVGFDENGDINKVVEKEVISSEATVGIYNFAKGSSFCTAANTMIESKKTVNGEYYVAPVYNELISKGKKIGIYNIGCEDHGMHGLGTPQDLEKFIESDVSIRATKNITAD